MTHYTLLGVPPKATLEQIKKAYYEKARINHPDKGGDSATMAELTEAWSILRDKKKRKLYDAQLLLLGKQSTPCERCEGSGTIRVGSGFAGGKRTSKCPKCGGSGVKEEQSAEPNKPVRR